MNWKGKTIAFTFVAVLAAAAYAQAEGIPCVPQGGTRTITAERPPAGHPGAQWVQGDGDPQAWEDDPGGADDPMGDAQGSDPASVDVDNSGGQLSGPNGQTQNGGSEGDCIEVTLHWTYRYPVTICKGGSSLSGFVASGECFTVWRRVVVESEPQTVCPCC